MAAAAPASALGPTLPFGTQVSLGGGVGGSALLLVEENAGDGAVEAVLHRHF